MTLAEATAMYTAAGLTYSLAERTGVKRSYECYSRLGLDTDRLIRDYIKGRIEGQNAARKAAMAKRCRAPRPGDELATGDEGGVTLGF